MPSWLTTVRIAWLTGFVAMGVGLYLGLAQAQQWAVTSLDNQQARSDWQSWKDDPEIHENRRPPKSTEPPYLLLLRDHFGGVYLGCFVVATALYIFMVAAVGGAIRTPPRAARNESPADSGPA
jgi:hypothetical protein